MSNLKFKIADISGKFIHPTYKGDLVGEILFELREQQIYYTCNLFKSDGTKWGLIANGVFLKVIPSNIDLFEYALKHAIVGINKTRIRRFKLYNVDSWHWRNQAT